MFQRHWSIALGVAIGVVLIPIISEEWVSWRTERELVSEQGKPVVEAKAVIVERSEDAVSLRVTGVKLRDCRLVGTQAFSVSKAVMTAAKMERDGCPPAEKIERDGCIPIAQIPRPVGPFDMGVVRVWPVGNDADEVVLYALHTCGPRNIEVRSTLARVKLHD